MEDDVNSVQYTLRTWVELIMNNQNVFNVSFGYKGIDTIPANAAVLLNECKKRIDGEFKTVTEYMAVSGVKSTKPIDIVIPILAVMLASARKRNGFNDEFKLVQINGESIKTGIQKSDSYAKWLKGNCIYKSNAQGELTKACVCDNGQLLRNTNLSVKLKHKELLDATGNKLRTLIHTQAKAIIKEMSLQSSITTEAKSIFVEAYKVDKK